MSQLAVSCKYISRCATQTHQLLSHSWTPFLDPYSECQPCCSLDSKVLLGFEKHLAFVVASSYHRESRVRLGRSMLWISILEDLLMDPHLQVSRPSPEDQCQMYTPNRPPTGAAQSCYDIVANGCSYLCVYKAS